MKTNELSISEEMRTRLCSAYERGKMACSQNKPRIPRLDDFCMKLLKGLKEGQSIPVMLAWYHGWDFENSKKDSLEKKETIS